LERKGAQASVGDAGRLRPRRRRLSSRPKESENPVVESNLHKLKYNNV